MPLAGFAATVLICEIYKRILEHTIKFDINDGEWDYLCGNFWMRHRSLEDMLTIIPSCLPLFSDTPKTFSNPNAIIFSVNRYSAVIALHHASAAVAERFCLLPQVLAASRAKLQESATAIATIVKNTVNAGTILVSILKSFFSCTYH